MLRKIHLYSHLFIALLFLSSAFVNNCQAADISDITELFDGQPINVTIEKNRDMKFFKYVYLDQENKRPDFSIMAIPLNSHTDPDIYVSSTMEHPGERDNEFADYSYGFDLVTVPYSHISSKNKTYYIGVQCQSKNCFFTLKAIKTDCVSLTVDQSVTLRFEEQANELVRFQIPEDPTITRIILVALPSNAAKLTRSIHMYVNKGNNPPSSSVHHIETTTAWLDGKAVVLLKGDEYFCTGCNYTLSIEAEKGAIMTVEAIVYGELIQTFLGDARLDAVSAGHSVTYVLDASEIKDFEQETLNIKVSPYAGAVSLHVHYNSVPKNTKDYAWHSESYGREVLVLKPEDLKGKDIKALYVTVSGLMTSTYRLFITGFTNFTTRLQLGIAESGYVRIGQIINFLFIPLNQGQTDITLTLSSSDGNPDLYVKSCPSKSNCEITYEEIREYKDGRKKQSDVYPIFLISDKVGDDTITFTHNYTECPRSSFAGGQRVVPPCVYTVAITNGGETDIAHYNLLATSTESHVRLEQNIPFRSHVDLGGVDYYYFMIFNDEGIESVSFQVTSISGIVAAYASTKVLYPNLTHHEAYSYLNDEIVFKRAPGKQLTHVYYLAVKGHTQSTYTILASVNYTVKAGSETYSVIKLYEGIPQKAVLRTNEVKLFKLELNLEQLIKDNQEASLRINLQPLQGQFQFYVNNNNSIPTNTSYQYASGDNNLYIDKDMRDFKAKATYLIAVYPNENYIRTHQNVSFVLSYVTGSKFIWLRSGDPYFTSISKNTTLFFKFEVEPAVESLEITKSMDSKTVDLFVSTHRYNLLPSKENYNFTTLDTGSDYISIPKSHIQKACAQNNLIGTEEYDEAHKCYFYISARTSATAPVHFNLMVNFNKSMVKLRNGVSLELPFPNTTTPLKLYYTPDVLEEVEFVASSPYRKLAIYANVLNIDDFKSYLEWPFPEKEKADFSSVSDLSTHKTSTVTISEDRLRACMQGELLRCVITLTVYKLERTSLYDFNEVDGGNNTLPSWITESFTIIATSGITPLPLGRPYVASVDKGKYKYFSFRVTEPNCTIMISVTPLTSGDPDIVVSKDGDRLPAIDLHNYDFSSISVAGEQLEISSEDLESKDMSGNWAVGVYGYSECTFQITVTYEKNKIIQIYTSIPHDITLKPGQTIYFQYYNWHDVFDIKLMNEYGQAMIKANTFNKTQEILDRLPKGDIAQFTSYKENNRERIRITNKTDNFCSGCYYLIGVSADGWSDFHGTLLVIAPGETIYMQNGRSFFYSVGKNEIQNFAFRDYENAKQSSLIISAIVYSGRPVIYVDHFPSPDSRQNAWKLDCDASGENPFGGASTCSLVIDDAQYWEQIGKGNQKTITKNGTTYEASPYDFYIAVEGKEASNFSILAVKSHTNITLRDGVPEPAFTLPKQQSVFIYNAPKDPDSDHQRLKVLISVFEHGGLATTTQNANASFIPEVTVTSSNMKKGIDEDLIEEPIYRKSISEGRLTKTLRGQMAFSVNQRKGQFKIYVNNPYDHILNYTITVQDRHFIKLPLNTIQMSRIDVGYSEVYEVYVEKKGQLLIDVFNCFGGVQVESTQSLIGAQKGEFPDAATTVSQNHVARALLVQPGPIFIRVRGVDGYIDDDYDPVKEALYKIRVTSWGENELTPQDKFFAKDLGIVTGTQLSSEIVSLSWSHVGFQQEDLDRLLIRYQVSVQYTLVFADDQVFAESKALCGVEPQAGGQFMGRGKVREPVTSVISLDKSTAGKLDKMTRELNVSAEDVRGSSYVAVVANVQGYTDRGLAWEVPIKYLTAEMKIEKVRATSGLWFFLTACFIGLIVIVAALWWYSKRFRSIESLLQYEMQETRYTAHTGEEPRTKKNKYTEIFNQSVDTA